MGMSISVPVAAPLTRVSRAIATTVATTHRVGRVVVVRVPDLRAPADRFRPGDAEEGA